MFVGLKREGSPDYRGQSNYPEMGGFQIVDLIPPLPAHHRVRTILPGRQAQGDHGRAGLLARPARGGGGGGEGGVPGHGHGEDDGQARTPRPAAVDGALPPGNPLCTALNSCQYIRIIHDSSRNQNLVLLKFQDRQSVYHGLLEVGIAVQCSDCHRCARSWRWRGTAVRMAAVSPGWDLSRARPAVGILL